MEEQDYEEVEVGLTEQDLDLLEEETATEYPEIEQQPEAEGFLKPEMSFDLGAVFDKSILAFDYSLVI